MTDFIGNFFRSNWGNALIYIFFGILSAIVAGQDIFPLGPEATLVLAGGSTACFLSAFKALAVGTGQAITNPPPNYIPTDLIKSAPTSDTPDTVGGVIGEIKKP